MIAVPTVSVIVCAFTLKRWDDLRLCVDSALAQPETTELILVIDHEDLLLARARARWPAIRVIANRHPQGLSGARNSALEIATGEVVAFLDDDATADTDWLRHLLSAFDDPAVIATGGTAVPRWPAGRPSVTLPPELLWVVGCSYIGQPTETAEVRNVVGCSMAFRLEPLLKIGGFNLETGRVGSIPLGNEETEVCIRLRQQDATRRIVFEPKSIVRHTVTPERMTWRYLRRRSFFEGVSKSALSRDLGASDALSSERSYAAAVLPAGAFRELRFGRPLGAVAIALSLASAGVGFGYGTIRGAATARTRPQSVAPIVRLSPVTDARPQQNPVAWS